MFLLVFHRAQVLVLYSVPLSSLIDTHSVSNQSFTNNTTTSLLPFFVCHNTNKLNDDKTEAVLIKSNRTTFPNTQLTSLLVGSADCPFKTWTRNLGFMISENMSLNRHISNVCCSAYLEIRSIISIRQYLTVEASKTLVCAFVLAKWDYCHSLLSGSPLYILRRLQNAQNTNHAEMIMYNLFVKHFIGYRSKAE